MHQPSYLDPLTNEMVLPWVRLHGVRGYYDIPFMARKFPDIRQTVNLVPVLLDQIKALAEGSVVDSYEVLSLKLAGDLDLADRTFMARNFFSCAFETMVKPYPRYLFLWQKVQSRQPVSDEDYQRVVGEMNVQDFLDLQMWFNLTWFGYGARNRYPEIEGWIAQGGNFSEAEKKALFALQHTILQELLPLYRKLAEEGRVEISTSPYYHPILPLLVSTKSARRAHPNLPLPDEFAHPEDAEGQISRALDRHEEIFGIRPKGMWPSEGSVSPEVAEIAARQKLSWMASDEDILRISREMAGKGEGTLYEPWEIRTGEERIRMVFRDRSLSDRIGFSYARFNGTEAAGDLIGQMENIARREEGAGREAVIPIILDGENPWEAYSDGGFHFLKTVYDRLSSHPVLKTRTVSGALEKVPARPIERLATGSWINHDFKIWIGHPEDNKGWNFLRETREAFGRALKEGKVSPEQIEMARQELYAAEGSDWFWWYGDDFKSLQSGEFDRLFRVHQQNVYRILGEVAPVILNEPVRQTDQPAGLSLPVDFIRPVIDGEVSHFFEWTGAGLYDNQKLQGAMYLRNSPLASLYFGFDEEQLYLRIDFDPHYRPEEHEAPRLDIRFLDRKETRFCLPLVPGVRDVPLSCGGDGSEGTARVAYQKVVEIAVPYTLLELEPGEWIGAILELYEDKKMVDQCPRGHMLSIQIPDDQFVKSIWRV